MPHTPFRIWIHPHATSESPVVYWGLPEWWEMHFVLRWLRPGETFVDVGANSGTFTLVACAVPDVRVVAYEPVDSSFARLERNVEENALSHRVVLRRRAVSDAPGEVRITTTSDTTNHVVLDDLRHESRPHSPSSDPGLHTDRARRDDGVATVPAVALDSETEALGAVSLLKIDVEGFEHAVISGAQQLIAECSPAVLCENNLTEASDLLAQLGYSPYRYDPDLHVLEPGPRGRTFERNLLWLRDLQEAHRRIGSSAVPYELKRAGEGC